MKISDIKQIHLVKAYSKKNIQVNITSGLLLLALYLLFSSSPANSACSNNIDMGNNNLLNVNNIQLTSINGLNYPTTPGQAGEVLQTDGNGNLSWVSISKGFFSIIGNPWSQSGTSSAAELMYSSTNLYSNVQTFTNDQAANQFVHEDSDRGYIKIKKAGTYRIFCMAPVKEGKSGTLFFKKKLVDGTITNLHGSAYHVSPQNPMNNSGMILVEVAANEKLGCQFSSQTQNSGSQVSGSLIIVEL